MQIIEKELSILFPPEHHQHVLLCQTPNYLERKELLYRLAQPERNWQQIQSVLEMVIAGDGNLHKVNFIFFPESSLPHSRVDSALEMVEKLRPNTVTVFGLGPINLSTYRELLQAHADDNRESLQSVTDDLESGDIDELPVNSCMIVVKEREGKVRVFFEAKSHPFVGEETLDNDHYLYRGKIFTLFRCMPSCFNFMVLICLDYVYRDIYQSNISTIIKKANELFFSTRQKLDLLSIIECNPKPEHPAFRDVANGFYGEYLERSPGVNDTVTLFCNASGETVLEESADDETFGHSSILLHKNHKMEQINMAEFSTDHFGGLPACRLRFGTGTRLFHFNLPYFHDLDPRTTRMPVRIHAIYRHENDHWVRLKRSEMTAPSRSKY
jgi:hypothetical protein